MWTREPAGGRGSGVPAASRDDRRPHWPPIRRDAALLDLRQRKSRDGKGQLRGEAGTTLVKLRVDDQQTVTRSRNGGREHQRWGGPRRDDACAPIVTREAQRDDLAWLA